MKIIVDGDACPRIQAIEKSAKQKGVKLLVFCDDNHKYELKYGKIICVNQGKNSADSAILKIAKKKDLIITNDKKLASMLMAKGCKCMNFNGAQFTDALINAYFSNQYLEMRAKKTNIPLKRKNRNARKNISTQSFARSLEAILCL